MGNKYIVLLLFIVNLGPKLQALEVQWYLPWDNDVNRLITDKISAVPVLNGGENYRILKISGIKSNAIKLTGRSDVAVLNFEYLPVMKDYRNKEILDVILPLNDQGPKQTTRFFLVRFDGFRTGRTSGEITIVDGTNKSIISKDIIVSTISSKDLLGVNVWAYFDYNEVLKGKKKEIEQILDRAGVNTLVVPPYVLPSITDKTYSFEKLRKYLPNTIRNFDKIVIYLGLDKDGIILNRDFQDSYSRFISLLRKELSSHDIKISNVYIYAIDEPSEKGITFLQRLIQIDKDLRLNSQFYTTIGSGMTKSITINNNAHFLAQISSKRYDKRPRFTSSGHTYWLYDVIAESRNIKPVYFLGKSFEAFKVGAKGVGFWNFCDISKAFNSSDLSNAYRNGSWNIRPSNPVYDYSLIYFNKDHIYASLRLVALSYAQDEFIFLSRFGSTAFPKGVPSQQMLSRNYSDWEEFKLSKMKGEK